MRVDGELRRHGSDRHYVEVRARLPEEVLGFMQCQQAGGVGEQPAVNVLAVVEDVAREEAGSSAGSQRDVDQSVLVVGGEAGMVRRLEHDRAPSRVVDCRDDDAMRTCAEGALAKQRFGLEQGSEGCLCVGGTQVAEERPALLEDLVAAFFEQRHHLLGRHFQGQRQGQDAADRGAGDQVEASRDRGADALFEVGEDAGGEESAVATAGQAQDAERGIGLGSTRRAARQVVRIVLSLPGDDGHMPPPWVDCLDLGSKAPLFR